MKILLTGSNGFVGSHLAEDLVKEGHEVICLVRTTSNCQWLCGVNAECRYGDITQPESLNAAVQGVDAVIHSVGVVRALRREQYYRVNQEGTRNLVSAVLSCNPGLKKFVYLSSQAAMGPSPCSRLKSVEEEATPVSDYGKSKLQGEHELRALEGRVPYIIFRPASVYGPRDKDVLIFFQLVGMGVRPLPLRKRYLQLVFVKDIVAATARSLRSSAADNKTYFLAEETPYSWEEIGKTIARAVAKTTLPLPLPDMVFHATSRVAESLACLNGKPAVLNRQKITEMLQPYWLGDPGPLRKDLHLDFTKLENGAKITYLWYKDNQWL